MKQFIAIFALVVGCFAQQIQISGGVSISGNVTTNTPPQVIVPQPPTVTPVQLPSGTTGVAYGLNGLCAQLTASNGTAPYTFAVSSGSLPTGITLSSAGALCGTPSSAGTSNFSVIATDSLSIASLPLALSIVVNSSLQITQTTVPSGIVGAAYSLTFAATGGSGAGYVFTLPAGTLPPGITLATPTISGTPTQSGAFPLTVTVTDSGANTASWSFTLTVSPPVITGAPDNRYCGAGDIVQNLPPDGPVTTIFTKCFNTASVNTPSLGAVRTTTAANFQATYNAAACGDVINVTRATSSTGPWVLNKQCDPAHYITIQGTGITDGHFPTEGTRASPCQSNVASLPNRPAYPCVSSVHLTAAVIAPLAGNAIQIKGASYHRLIGLEITRVSTPGQVFALVDLTNATTQTNHIIFDRIWFHGINQDGNFPLTPTTDTGTTRAIFLGQSNNIALIDSYISDIYNDGNVSANTDAQVVSGGVGGIANSGWGVYKIVNNHCEGSSEGCIILGGGGGPALTPPGCTFGTTCNVDVPTNVEVRRNLVFAPLSWNGNTTSIVTQGWPNRKNGAEFKSAANVLFEANVMQNCWYSSQPFCYGFDFAPKNQSNSPATPTVGTCPTCLVQDAVARNNYVYNYPGHQIALYSTQDLGCSTCSTLGRRISIHDNLVGDSLNKGSLGLGGFDCIQFLADAGPVTNVSFRHNTCIGAVTAMISTGSRAIGQFDQVIIQDNLLAEGNFGVQASSNSNAGCDNGGTGGPVYDSTNNWLGILNHCVNGTTNTWAANHNGTWGANALANWPTGNFALKANLAAVGFTTVPGNNSSGFPDSGMTPADWILTGGSTFHNAASDGADVGANVTQLVNEISGVASY